MTLADHLASADAPNLRHVDLPDLNELFARAKLAIKDAASHQVAAGAHVGNMILTAPTGSGKTEAALVWAARQRMQGLWPSNVVYVLPYQASLIAMSRRLKRSLNTEVGLLHGRSAQVLYRELVAEATPNQAERRARRATDLARLRQPCVTASTPYQLLRGAYRLRGYESQWMSLSGALLIVDEIHAYETKRLGLLLGLLAALVTHWDTRVASITATLPTWLRQLLRETIRPQEIEASSEVYEQFQRHSVSLLNGTLDSPPVLDLICNDVRNPLSVLVVVNTIKDAQAMWATLSSRLPEHNVLILHSRFTSDDRLRCEEQIMTRLNGTRNGGKPVVLVSTQAVEVSLDLDFDTLYTQPAPLEALAQRFGRVNRRGRKRIVPVHVLTEPQGGQGIYDPRLVERALDVLTQHDGEPIDEGRLTTWLNDVYDGGLGDEYMSKVRASKKEFEQVCLAELRAFESDDAVQDAFEALFDGTEVLPASLEAKFDDRMEQSVLSAHGLLVPMPYTALHRYRDKIRIRPVDRIKVIDLPYDQNLGLQLTR